jgi:hypothetical protein
VKQQPKKCEACGHKGASVQFHFGMVQGDFCFPSCAMARQRDADPPQRGPGFGLGHVVPEGMVQAPAQCRYCGTAYVNETTGLLRDTCSLCHGPLDHTPASGSPAATEGSDR